MPRIAVGMISHETNSFSPIATTLSSFAEERFGVLEGDDLLRDFAGSKTGIGGFLEIGEAQGWEMIGTVAASATPRQCRGVRARRAQGHDAGSFARGRKA